MQASLHRCLEYCRELRLAFHPAASPLSSLTTPKYPLHGLLHPLRLHSQLRKPVDPLQNQYWRSPPPCKKTLKRKKCKVHGKSIRRFCALQLQSKQKRQMLCCTPSFSDRTPKQRPTLFCFSQSPLTDSATPCICWTLCYRDTKHGNKILRSFFSVYTQNL